METSTQNRSRARARDPAQPPAWHLVTHTLCPYVQRSIITLEEKSIAYTRTDIDLANKPDWFLLLSPMGKVPVLLLDGHSALFESRVICEYLDEITPGSLHPEDCLEKAYHRAWIEFGSGILDNIAGLYNVKTECAWVEISDLIRRKFQRVEREISGTPFFAGDRFHLIDAAYAPIFRYFDVIEPYIELRVFDQLEKVSRWRAHLRHRKTVAHAVRPEYPEDLLRFLIQRKSYMSSLIARETEDHG